MINDCTKAELEEATRYYPAIWDLRSLLTTDHRQKMKPLDAALPPSGPFRGPSEDDWPTFCASTFAGWSEPRKTAGIVMLAPEIKAHRRKIIASWVGKELPDCRLNTVLAALVKVSSGAIGNALRAVKYEREMFLRVLVGEQSQFQRVASRRRLKRHSAVESIREAASAWLQAHPEKLSVVLVNSDIVSDASSMSEILLLGNALQTPGYVIWLRSNPDMSPPTWWTSLQRDYPRHAPFVKKQILAEDYFRPAGESVLIDRLPSGLLRWRRVSLLKKVVKGVSPEPINEVFAAPDSLQKKLRSSEELALEQLFRRFKLRRTRVFTPTSDITFVGTLARALCLADLRLVHPGASIQPPRYAAWSAA